MITRMVSNLQSGEQQRRIILKEKLENSRKIIYRDIMCFKIMKFAYTNFIYTKNF